MRPIHLLLLCHLNTDLNYICCPLPTLEVALLAAFNPGESIRFEHTHVGLMSDRERERICFV